MFLERESRPVGGGGEGQARIKIIHDVAGLPRDLVG